MTENTDEDERMTGRHHMKTLFNCQIKGIDVNDHYKGVENIWTKVENRQHKILTGDIDKSPLGWLMTK